MTSPPSTSPAPTNAPFASAAEAWFWTMGTLLARRSTGARHSSLADAVIKALDGLYRRRRIDLTHARVLRIWGERQMPPPVVRSGPPGDRKLWNEALERLEWALRTKGIVA